MKFLRVLLIILFFTSFCGCITQESDSKDMETEIQPELNEEEFIELVNNILVEKVSLEMFDFQYGKHIYIRNTFDCNKAKIRIAMYKMDTRVYISINPGHFRGESYVHLQMIDTKCLFTSQIENQADFTPPSSFKKTQTYNIEVMGYKGELDVCRGHVSFFFKNIGELSYIPPPPPPRSFISKALPYIVISIFVLVLVSVRYGIILLRRRITS
ncbi:MAG: hypothetical protein PVF58_22720 [Candidatus Methanofastidiosia archaeon]|jgi:hypothetical protein